MSRPVVHRVILAGVGGAMLAAATLPAVATTATTTTTTPARGRAVSTVTLLRLDLAGVTASAGQVDAVADSSVTPHVAQVLLTPLDSTVTGAVGQTTVTAANSPATVPAPAVTAALPGGLGGVTGPGLTATATDDAAGVVTTATASALGTVDLLDVPLDLRTASLSDVAQVVATGATAQKTLTIGTVALPSLDDLLTGLGVDLTKLLDQLTRSNLDTLAGLVGADVGALDTAVDTAQTDLTAAGQTPADTLAGATAELSDATDAMTAAQGAFTDAWNTAYGGLSAPARAVLDAALAAANLSSPLSADQFLALDPTTANAVLAAFGQTAVDDLTQLAQAAADAEHVVALATTLDDALQSLVTGVLSAVAGDADPIASLGGLTLVTSAVAADTPSASAAVTVGSIDVLGTAEQLGRLTDTVDGLMATLADVVDSVPGVVLTPPSIAVGTPTHSVGVVGTTRHASAAVTGVTITLPGLTLPAALSTTGDAVSVPSGSLVLGRLAETARWTPSVTTTSTATPSSSNPTTPQQSNRPGSSPSLAGTGGTPLLPMVATSVVVVAAVLRRRWGRLLRDDG